MPGNDKFDMLCSFKYEISEWEQEGPFIFHEEYAFVFNLSIYDNILVIQKIVHSLYNFKGQNPYIMLKLDLKRSIGFLGRPFW